MKVVLLLAALSLPALAHAQTVDCPALPSATVVDPTQVCFKAPDWNKTANFGTPLVNEASIAVYVKGTDTNGTPVSRHQVGKPAAAGVDASGVPVIIATFTRDPNEKQDGKTEYVGIVEQVGQGAQVSRSPLSNPFGWSQVVPAPTPATAPIITRP